MAPTTSAGRLPADASPGPSPSPPTAWAPRSQGGPARRRWPRGGLIRGGPASRAAVSGATLAAASESVSQQRRGGRNRTARGAEPATGVRCADGEGLHPAQRVAVTPASSSQRHRVAAQGIASQAYDISPHATGTRPASVLDLKADCRGYKYVEETIKLLPEKPAPILLAKILNRVAGLGRIHTAQPSFSFS